MAQGWTREDCVGNTPFHYLIESESFEDNYNNHILCFKKLLKHANDVNLKNNIGAAVLHEVSRGGYTEAVEAVLECGGNVNVRDGAGNTPLHLIVAGALVESESEYEYEMPNDKYASCLEMLIKHGGNLKIENDLGQSPVILFFSEYECLVEAYDQYFKCGRCKRLGLMLKHCVKAGIDFSQT